MKIFPHSNYARTDTFDDLRWFEVGNATDILVVFHPNKCDFPPHLNHHECLDILNSCLLDVVYSEYRSRKSFNVCFPLLNSSWKRRPLFLTRNNLVVDILTYFKQMSTLQVQQDIQSEIANDIDEYTLLHFFSNFFRTQESPIDQVLFVIPSRLQPILPSILSSLPSSATPIVCFVADPLQGLQLKSRLDRSLPVATSRPSSSSAAAHPRKMRDEAKEESEEERLKSHSASFLDVRGMKGVSYPKAPNSQHLLTIDQNEKIALLSGTESFKKSNQVNVSFSKEEGRFAESRVVEIPLIHRKDESLHEDLIQLNSNNDSHYRNKNNDDTVSSSPTAFIAADGEPENHNQQLPLKKEDQSYLLQRKNILQKPQTHEISKNGLNASSRAAVSSLSSTDPLPLSLMHVESEVESREKFLSCDFFLKSCAGKGACQPPSTPSLIRRPIRTVIDADIKDFPLSVINSSSVQSLCNSPSRMHKATSLSTSPVRLHQSAARVSTPCVVSEVDSLRGGEVLSNEPFFFSSFAQETNGKVSKTATPSTVLKTPPSSKIKAFKPPKLSEERKQLKSQNGDSNEHRALHIGIPLPPPSILSSRAVHDAFGRRTCLASHSSQTAAGRSKDASSSLRLATQFDANPVLSLRLWRRNKERVTSQRGVKEESKKELNRRETPVFPAESSTKNTLEKRGQKDLSSLSAEKRRRRSNSQAEEAPSFAAVTPLVQLAMGLPPMCRVPTLVMEKQDGDFQTQKFWFLEI
eukprot:GDKJ01019963.1.p1 GENE.GDKJ01019963.1~~GDKJ01019963.1.p1  ORF type:complete len:749 (+),score=173.61 GDKJ01019963.1:32-2278(+)